jgi:hypothetical protein
MGYELLDSHGGSRAVPGGGLLPDDVVALDDLPSPQEQPPPPPPLWVRRLRQLAGLDDGRAPDDPHRRRAPRITWVVAGAACLLGVMSGAWWGGQHAEGLQRAKARSAVTAVASPMNAAPIQTGAGPAADVTVRVDNVSDLPADVVVTPPGQQPSLLRPAVHLVTGSAHLAPHGQALVVVRVPLRCDSPDPLSVSVPMRAVDGTLHQLRVREADDSLASSPYQLCEQLRGDSQAVDVTLAGQLDSPSLELHNNTATPVIFRVDDQTPAEGADGPNHPVSIVTTPSLPVRVAAHAVVRLGLTVRLQGCDGDLSRLSQLQTFLPFRAENPLGAEVGYAGVDVSPLVGARLVDHCR